jgi:hypothetical protein
MAPLPKTSTRLKMARRTRNVSEEAAAAFTMPRTSQAVASMNSISVREPPRALE